MRMMAMAAVLAGMVGGGSGAAAASLPPEWVRTYIETHEVEPITVEGNLAVGTRIPDDVMLNPIPGFDYAYVVVQGRPVLVHPTRRQIVYVYP